MMLFFPIRCVVNTEAKVFMVLTKLQCYLYINSKYNNICKDILSPSNSEKHMIISLKLWSRVRYITQQ